MKVAANKTRARKTVLAANPAVSFLVINHLAGGP
jgi:hypothetical protein